MADGNGQPTNVFELWNQPQDGMGFGPLPVPGAIRPDGEVNTNPLTDPDDDPPSEGLWAVDDWNLGQSEYDFRQLVFPSDLADSGTGTSVKNSYQGHYMVINISVSDKSNYENVQGPGLFGNQFNKLPGEVSKTDALRFRIDNQYKDIYGQQLGRTFLDRPRFTTRIKESIALVMPNAQLDFSDVHDYQSVSLLELGQSFASGVTGFVTGTIGAFGGRSVRRAIGGFGFGGAASSAGQAIRTGAVIAGIPINPKTEVLFTNTAQREFSFEFLLSPTNAVESLIIKKIIRTLRFHAAPELQGGNDITAAPKSFFFVPPSEFDITFYHRGEENTNINRINTCVLERMDVSYAPIGIYSTFSNGYPVSVRMMLHFREVEITHRLRVMQGF
tara:strand:- start:68961 stop:70121 length:1161 start_codon:yes stop_codon:yes gene_type:complete